MRKTHHDIQTLSIEQPRFFEDKAWPLQTALAAFCGLLAIVIVARLPLEDPNPLHNGFVWLFALVIVYVGSVIGIQSYRGVKARRGYLLSFLLSLFLNLSLLIVLSLLNVFSIGWENPETVAKNEQREQVVEFEITTLAGEERREREFDRPVDAGSPMQNDQHVVRQTETTPDLERTADEPSADEIAESTPMQEIQRRTTPTVPRFADMQGTISRQSVQRNLEHSKPTLQDSPNPQHTELAQMREAPADVQRQQTEIAPTQIDADPEFAVAQSAESTDVSRQEPETGAPEIASAESTLPRRIRSPVTLPNAAVEAASADAVAQETSDDPVTPDTTIAQQETESPEMRVVSAPMLDSPDRPSPRQISRRQPAPETPQMASVTEPISRPDVLRRTPTTSNAATQNEQQIAQDSPDELPSVQPAETQLVQRQQQQSTFTPHAPTQSNEIESTVRDTESVAERTRPNDLPNQIVAANSASNPMRSALPSANRAPETASPRAVDKTQLTQSDVANQQAPLASAGPTAIAKSVQGVAGSRGEPNFDSESPARPSLVDTASAAAQRQNATQTEPGPALAPSDAPAIRRSRADALSPSASMVAREVDSGDVAGSQDPQEVDASSSSALVRAGSNAEMSETMAQTGEANVDFGPTRLADSTGQERASGGGQPDVNFDNVGRLIPRSSSTGPPVSAPASQFADIPTAPSSSNTGDASAEPVSPSSHPIGRIASTDSSATSTSSAQPALDSFHDEPLNARSSLASTSSASASRAESVDARVNEVVQTGGGSESPQRATRGRTARTETDARVFAATGSTESSGDETSVPLAADGSIPNRAASGIPSRTQEALTGALADDEAFAGQSTGDSKTTLQRRTLSPAKGDGPAVASAYGQGLPVRRSRSTRLPSGALSATPVDAPLAGSDARENETQTARNSAVATDVGPQNRNDNGGLAVRIDATEGVGGLATDPSKSVGLNRRRANAESQNVVATDARFIRKNFGAPISLDTRASIAAAAFRNRLNRRGDSPDIGGRGRPSPKTEQAIEAGLVFLSRQQLDDGSWSLNYRGDGRQYPEDERATIISDTSATGLALLAFLGAGYHHQDDKYRDVVRDGLDFLIDFQRETGDLYLPQDEESNRSARLYSHGIAAIALCEAYGMTKDPRLEEPAQAALDFIVASQNPERGGWRYAPGVSSDTSVTGWMIMALRSGELAGLSVPKSTFEKIESWLDISKASNESPHLYRYNPFAPDSPSQRHGRRVTRTMTSVGLLMRLYTGWRRDRSEMVAGADYLLQNLPDIGTPTDPKRDTYYWYYATQVMFHMGDKYWEEWNGKLHPLLTESQITTGPNAGSWNPKQPVSDRWAAHGGRLYVTTLNLLSLEVYYRHLPIYDDTAK